MNLQEEALALFSYTRDLRRDLHRHPELGFREFYTAGRIALELEKLGLEVHKGVAGTGVVALIEGEKPGAVVLARFDMDALPVQEETGLDFSSQNPVVMHACGHDGHVAVGLTVARLLAAHRDELWGGVKLVFQPAEEGLGGAEGMIAAGVLENPHPDHCLALHLWNDVPVGTVVVHEGPLMASSAVFTVQIQGKGGHAALPHLTADPILAASQVITALQSIVSRNVPPLEAAVVSVTQIHGGSAQNVIPPLVELGGTIRTFDPGVHQRVFERFEGLIQNVCRAMECEVSIKLDELTPAVVNAAEAVAVVQFAAGKHLPAVRVDSEFRTMVSEDMAFFMDQIPGCYFLVGSANPETGKVYAHHHPKFDFDESALVTASTLMTGSIMEFLK
jgi:amidohydrolase